MPKKCRVCGAPLDTNICHYCRTDHSGQQSETQANQMDSFQNTHQDHTGPQNNHENFNAMPQNHQNHYQPNHFAPPVKDKLAINVVAGIFAIISALVAIFYNVSLWGTVAADMAGVFVTDHEYVVLVLILVLLVIFALISLVLHIVGLVQSKKNGISILGHVLGIVASAIVLITFTFLSFISILLYILAAVFAFIQKKVPKTPYQQHRY